MIVLGMDEARALHNSGKNRRASFLAEVVGIVLDVAVAVNFGARPPACPLFGGRARPGVCPGQPQEGRTNYESHGA